MLVSEIPKGAKRELVGTELDFKCDVCGTLFKLKYDTWRKSKNAIRRCFPCNQAYRHSLINNLPEDEREAYYRRKNYAISKGWNSRSEEAKEITSQKRIEMWANRSKEEMDAIRSHRKDVWANRDPEKKDKIIEALTRGREEYHETLTLEKAQLSYLKRALSFNCARISDKELSEPPNQIESEFINMLTNRGLKYIFSWYNTQIHEDFNKLFDSKNPAGVKNNNPYHKWDFLIKLKSGDILVDIDGSIHGPKNTGTITLWNDKKCLLKEIIDYQDSQRPYQTDGLKAYVIKAHYDIISDDSEVLGLHDNSKQPLRSFLTILEWDNKSTKEQKQIVKDSFK